MKIAGYCRVSTKHQAKEGSSLQSQEDAIKKYAKDNNHQLMGIYREAGVSGEKDSRPQLDLLMKDAEEKKFEQVVLLDLDRFGRSMTQILNNATKLDSLGIDLYCLTGQLSIPDPMIRKLLIGLLGWVAEYENKMRRERSIRGRSSKLNRKEVHFHRKPIFPFKFSDNPHAKSYQLDPASHKIYQMILKWKLEEQLADEKIAMRLNQLPEKERVRKTWRGNKISRILKNKSLSDGYVTLGQVDLNGDRQELKVAFKPLIDQATYQRILDVYEGNLVATPGKSIKTYLLSRLLKCHRCGATLQIYTDRANTYYRCKNRKLHSCSLPYFRRDEGERLILWEIYTTFSDDDKFKKAMQKAFREGEEINLEELAAKKAEYIRAKNKLMADSRELLTDHLKGLFRAEVLQAQSDEIERQIKFLDEEVTKIMSLEDMARQNQALMERIGKKRFQLLEKLKSGSDAVKRQVLKELLVGGKIVVDNNGQGWWMTMEAGVHLPLSRG